MLSAAKLGSLLDVCESYDCLLLDQFGVIHDGTTAYDGAVSAVAELQRRGKKIVIISNSSRRRGDTVARLRQMGFAISDDDVVTSGDLVFEGLLAEHAGLMATLPPAPAVVDVVGSGGGGGAAVAEPALLAESELIAAEPRLWAALSSELRKALLDERVRGVSAGPHSMQWPGW